MLWFSSQKPAQSPTLREKLNEFEGTSVFLTFISTFLVSFNFSLRFYASHVLDDSKRKVLISHDESVINQNEIYKNTKNFKHDDAWFNDFFLFWRSNMVCFRIASLCQLIMNSRETHLIFNQLSSETFLDSSQNVVKIVSTLRVAIFPRLRALFHKFNEAFYALLRIFLVYIFFHFIIILIYVK